VVEAGKRAGIDVALCGEMAGDPLCTSFLVGLGIDEFSLNATGIPIIKKIIRSLSLEESRKDLEEIFELDTATRVREVVKAKMRPLLKELDQQGLITSFINQEKRP
jgi:phosphotransferase system enzyme I (PtsI)